VRTLGRFEVLVDGTPVPAAAWQSRKARDLLRILVARRGRGISRDELGELLWPDDDPSRTSHRLSVALSTVRAVLDPDKLRPANHFVLADQDRVALDLSRLVVDIETFLAEAEHGLRLVDRGDHQPYDAWADAIREEAWATYLAVTRSLVQLCRQAGDTDAAVRYLHAFSPKTPTTSRSTGKLIATLRHNGSHGEAHRAQQRYTDAMRRGRRGAEPSSVGSARHREGRQGDGRRAAGARGATTHR
jgi:DNA-binding SARP family transcriptional activator